MIDLQEVTHRFSSGRGIERVSFRVGQGEVFGFIGPNGAGKSTTIRTLLGFIKAQSGRATINGLDCWQHAARIQQYVGYLPGETAFFDQMTGDEFLRLLYNIRQLSSTTLQQQLIDRFEFSPRSPIRKMSKGMKQKLALVAAFMHDPDVLVLDEPTSGLDPLMQARFIELILAEKARGKTILMSSHVFGEMERTCDRAAMIKDGRIIMAETVEALHALKQKRAIVTFRGAMPTTAPFAFERHDEAWHIPLDDNWDEIIRYLAQWSIADIAVHTTDLQQLFLEKYEKEATER